MKKIWLIGFVLLFSISIVAAQSDLGSNLGYGMQQLIEIVEGLLGPLFAVFLGESEFLFEKILFFAIVLSVVYVVISRVDYFGEGSRNVTLKWIITIAVSLLSTRFLGESGLVQTMLLPYSVLGVALTAAIPLVIYFAFVQSFQDSGIIRRTLWIFFMVVFMGLWGSRYEELGSLSWIYFVTALLALIFFLFDGTIRSVMVKIKMEQLGHDNRDMLIADLRKRKNEINDHVANQTMDNKTAKRIIKKINRQIETLKRMKN